MSENGMVNTTTTHDRIVNIFPHVFDSSTTCSAEIKKVIKWYQKYVKIKSNYGKCYIYILTKMDYVTGNHRWQKRLNCKYCAKVFKSYIY